MGGDMIECPYCSSENIEGVDLCEECGQPLTDRHWPVPATEVERGLMQDRVSTVQSQPPVMVSPMTTVGQVLQLMVDRKVGCVVVSEAGRPIGMFSERDALRKLNVNVAALRSKPVSEFMTPNPQTVLANAKIAFAVQRMDLGSYRHLPIIDEDGKVTAVISARDIINYLTARMSVSA